MATFRSVRWIFFVAVFCGSFISTGATFAPLSSSFQGSLDPMRLGPSMESRVLSDSIDVKFSSRRDAALSRLGALVFAERAIATSA